MSIHIAALEKIERCALFRETFSASLALRRAAMSSSGASVPSSDPLENALHLTNCLLVNTTVMKCSPASSILIRAGKVLAVGPEAIAPLLLGGEVEIDCGGKWIMPGDGNENRAIHVPLLPHAPHVACAWKEQPPRIAEGRGHYSPTPRPLPAEATTLPRLLHPLSSPCQPLQARQRRCGRSPKMHVDAPRPPPRSHAGLCDAHVHCSAVTADLSKLISMPESYVASRAAGVWVWVGGVVASYALQAGQAGQFRPGSYVAFLVAGRYSDRRMRWVWTSACVELWRRGGLGRELQPNMWMCELC